MQKESWSNGWTIPSLDPSPCIKTTFMQIGFNTWCMQVSSGVRVRQGGWSIAFASKSQKYDKTSSSFGWRQQEQEGKESWPIQVLGASTRRPEVERCLLTCKSSSSAGPFCYQLLLTEQLLLQQSLIFFLSSVLTYNLSQEINQLCTFLPAVFRAKSFPHWDPY